MPPSSASSQDRGRRLVHRDAERGELDSLLEAFRRVGSRSLVIRGEPGVGETPVDLIGHCASETIAGKYSSSRGGQADFAGGATWSDGGEAFVVFNSTTSIGEARAALSSPPAVTTIKNAVDVVTEDGFDELPGASIAERARRRLVAIAHPDHREQLRFDAQKAGLLP